MFSQIKDLLTPAEKRRGMLLFLMILVMGIIDMIGVASIMPFIAVLSDPDVIEENHFLNIAFLASKDFGVREKNQFLFLLGICFFSLLVASISFKALTSYAQIRFVLRREFSITKRLMEGYVRQPYDWFLMRNSSDLGKTLLSEVSVVTSQAISPFITVIAQSFVAMLLLGLLFYVDPLVALIIGVSLVGSYVCVFFLMNKILKQFGASRVKANLERFAAISEVFGAVKEVKVSGLEGIYSTRFAKPAEMYAKSQSISQVSAQLPRFALEAIAFGGMLLVILYFMKTGGGLQSALPVIALYAVAGYRLLPALQQIYAGVSQLRFHNPALQALHQDYVSVALSQTQLASRTGPLIQGEITLDGVDFSYPGSRKPTLRDINLTISKGSHVAFIGETGSGKTTAVDVILALLAPQIGELRVNGERIDETNARNWQRSIGYVPQNIYLSDSSVAQNIAFGVREEDIDYQRLEESARGAILHDFIINELPEGYSTQVGERGIRLSGGQRQRIGIARALYRRPAVLLLDEATSALDGVTEAEVMRAIEGLGRDTTVILVAHRLSTVKTCDTLFLFHQGRVVASGSFHELASTSDLFNRMLGSQL